MSRNFLIFCIVLVSALYFINDANAFSLPWGLKKRAACPGMCKEPKASSSCGMSMSKWWYNAKKKSCEPFVYEGCGGNENRFGSQGLCEKMCKAKC